VTSIEFPIRLTIPGIPAPGGSKKAFFDHRSGKIKVIDACKRNLSWKKLVGIYAKSFFKSPLLEGPLVVRAQFILLRPKSHYRTGRYSALLKPQAPQHHVIRPDATKLWRPTEDALTGIIWKDDAQIIQQFVTKEYSTDKSGCNIEIRPWYPRIPFMDRPDADTLKPTINEMLYPFMPRKMTLEAFDDLACEISEIIVREHDKSVSQQ